MRAANVLIVSRSGVQAVKIDESDECGRRKMCDWWLAVEI